MIIKKSALLSTDSTNVVWAQTFHLYKGFFRKKSLLGLFIKNNIKKVQVPRTFYKGFKVKYHKKGDVARSIITKTVFFYKTSTLLKKKSYTNLNVLIHKKNITKGKKFYGFVFKNISFKKVMLLFKKII